KSHQRVHGQCSVHSPQQLVQSFPRQRRNKHRRFLTRCLVRPRRPKLLALLRRKLVHFVEHTQSRPFRYSEFAQNLLGLPVQLVMIRVCNVAHLQQQRGFLLFLERRPERRNQPFRQSPDESNRVRHEYSPVRRQPQRSHCRVQRRKHLRRYQHFCPAQRI